MQIKDTIVGYNTPGQMNPLQDILFRHEPNIDPRAVRVVCDLMGILT
jgi:hypothetical protein